MNNADKIYATLRFKNKIYESQGQTFEDFFVLIMTKVYENFQPVRAYGRIGDKKMMDSIKQLEHTIKYFLQKILLKKVQFEKQFQN